MQTKEKQTFFTYVPDNNYDPPIQFIVYPLNSYRFSDLKRYILNSLGKKHVSTSSLALSFVQANTIKRTPDDDSLVHTYSCDAWKGQSLYAFAVNSYPPNAYACAICQNKCNDEVTTHNPSNSYDSNSCCFIICNSCKEFKDNCFTCPVCFKSVNILSLTKDNSKPNFEVEILNIPILLRRDKGTTQQRHEKYRYYYDLTKTKVFGYPRLLKLPSRVTGAYLQELVKLVVPQGKYSLHTVDLSGTRCSQSCSKQNCTGCVVSERSTLNFKSGNAIAVHYSECIPKMLTPVLYTDGVRQSLQNPLPQCDPIQPLNSRVTAAQTQQIESQLQATCRKLKNDIEKMQSKYNATQKDLKELETLRQELEELRTMRQGLEELKTLRQEVENLKQVVEVTKTMPRENKLVKKLNPFNHLKFSGRKDLKHPKRFIESFERFANQEKLNDNDKQYYFIQSLVKDAAVWLEAQGYGTYEEMKEAFLSFYWSPHVQGCFLNHLHFGKYNQDCGLSMSDYFFKNFNEAKFIDEAPNETDLITFLMGHFDSNVKDKLQKQRVQSIEEVLGVLIRLETVKKSGVKAPIGLIQNISLQEVFDKTDKVDLNKDSKINDLASSNDDINQQETSDKMVDSEIDVHNIPSSNLANSLTASETESEIWEDCFGYQYEKHAKDGKKFYWCMTERVWPLHTIEDAEKTSTKVQNFGIYDSDKLSVYIDIRGKPVEHKILGPITVSRQVENQLIISTCASFRSLHYLVAGQVLFVKDDDIFKPCSIVTCSVLEKGQYRYIISNYKEQIACFSCEDEIQEVEFCESRLIAAEEDLDVYYWEQWIQGEERTLRFLNQNYDVIYTVLDNAVEKYDPLCPTYH